MAIRLPRVMVPVLSRSSVSTSPAASTARPLRAMTFLREQPVHAAMPMAESRPADGGGDEAHQERHHRRRRQLDPAVDASGTRRHAGEEEDQGQPHQQDVQGDLVGRLLPRGALHQGDHPVEERLAGVGGDADHDPVGEDRGAAGHRAAVAAALADDRGRLAGDRALVDRGDALDDLAVAGDVLPGLHHYHVTLAQDARRRPSPRAVHQLAGPDVLPHLPQRVRLGLAPALGHRLGEVGEQHGEPEPER